MPTEIDARITPSLHSENVKQLDGYSDDSAPYLGPVMETLDDAYLTLGKIHDARDHASRNQAWTPEQAVIAVSDAAYKQQQRLLSKFDKLSKTLDQQIKSMDEMLTGPLQQKAGMGTLNTEIRNHVRAMPTEERQKFLEEALARKDLTSLTAILGGPGYLSGLMDAEVTHYTRKLHEIQHPEVVGRLTALRSAKAHVEKVGPLVMGQVEKAMGADWGRVTALREGNSKALAALKFGDGL